MANQFYVGQRVRVINTSHMKCEAKNWLLEAVPDVSKGDEFIADQYDPIGWEGVPRLMLRGIPHWHPVDKFESIDPPRTVLTDWQRKQIEQFRNGTNDQVVIQMDKLISILSEPEPPKYIPKHGEAVQLRDNYSDIWLVDVFYEMTDDGIYKGYNMVGKFCRPFDAALVGQITND